MPRTKPHTGGNRLFVAAIEQTQRDQQQCQTQTQRQCGKRGTSGIAPEIAPADLRQKKNTSHC